jgi:hypothetical protein
MRPDQHTPLPTIPDLDLLRLHVAAGWGVRLPPLTLGDVSLLPGGRTPRWALYLAEVAGGSVRLWRPDVAAAERAALLARAEEALALPRAARASAGIHREVAHHLAAPPARDMAAARQIARLIPPHDGELIATLGHGYTLKYLAHPKRAPVVGVVVNDRLVSIAHSSRRTADACELGIETVPEARRRGYALAATIVWTAAVLAEQLVPLYSARAENAASLALAVAAGYRPFARAAYLAR